MDEPSLTLDLPLASTCRLFDWFGDRSAKGWFCFEHLYLTAQADTLAVRQSRARAPMLRIPLHRASSFECRELEVAPGLRLMPVNQDALQAFIQSQAFRPDHIGLNVSHAALPEPGWLAFIEAIAVLFPAYRLSVASNNDVVMVLFEDWVLELVYDRSSTLSSFHLCLTVDAQRATVERYFPSPYGGYKTGDAPFFRTVALPSRPDFPCYLDMAFSDGAMQPWRDIVHALGRRLSAGNP